ncbi:hypothetical protein HPP92_002190 [Vanilla planifolia]|uniref:Adaptor protein ClpS core domain-containing protein n=1 Tax=Vanilla planifolia TaxID=51239 RepID=A0A835VM97_VANPL|nr:hypothetical protein HPP92_002190 [Vanilla planifolia]
MGPNSALQMTAVHLIISPPKRLLFFQNQHLNRSPGEAEAVAAFFQPMALSFPAVSLAPLKLSVSAAACGYSSSAPSKASFIPALSTTRPEGAKRWEAAMNPFRGKRKSGSSKGGTSVIEKPTFDQSQFDPLPKVMEGGDIGKLGDKWVLGGGGSYRVLLVDDARHTEKLVANALPQIVPSITPDDARTLFHESRNKGASIVTVALKEHAEFYAQMMLQHGLRSAIEPDSDLA